MKAIIVGAGIGGLVTAIALSKQGIDVEIYEGAKATRASGSGLTLWSNAIRALASIGIDVMSTSIPFGGSIRQSDGRILSQMNPAQLQARFGMLPVAIGRGDLMQLLTNQLDVDIHYGYRLSNYTQSADQICAHFENGETSDADVLIGADGIYSTVRMQMFPEAKPIYRGYAVWRGIASHEHVAGDWGETWGREARFGMIPLQNNQIYWFATSNRSQQNPPINHHVALEKMLNAWHKPIADLIASTPEEAILYHDIYDIEPLSTWCDGQAVLVGDAAHAMTPNMGQGACQAIEDAVVLGNLLAKHARLQDALLEYESQRLAHVNRVVSRSRQMGAMGQIENPVLIALRNTLVRLTPSKMAMKQLDFVLSNQYM